MQSVIVAELQTSPERNERKIDVRKKCRLKNEKAAHGLRTNGVSISDQKRAATSKLCLEVGDRE